MSDIDVKQRVDAKDLIEIAKAIAPLMTGSEITQLFGMIGVSEFDTSPSESKWIRLSTVMQKTDCMKDGNDIATILIESAFNPVAIRQVDGSLVFEARNTVNDILRGHNLCVGSDGKVSVIFPLFEPSQKKRDMEFMSILRDRNCHPRILNLCSREHLADWHGVILEALKDLDDRISQLAGGDLSGSQAANALAVPKSGHEPKVMITLCRTQTEKDIQNGFSHLVRGIFMAYRNPLAHTLNEHLDISQQDALDVLAVISLIHRKLDTAQIRSTPSEWETDVANTSK